MKTHQHMEDRSLLGHHIDVGASVGAGIARVTDPEVDEWHSRTHHPSGFGAAYHEHLADGTPVISRAGARRVLDRAVRAVDELRTVLQGGFPLEDDPAGDVLDELDTAVRSLQVAESFVDTPWGSEDD